MTFAAINPVFIGLGKELPPASTGRPREFKSEQLRPLRRNPGSFAVLCEPTTDKAEIARLRTDVRNMKINLWTEAAETQDPSLLGIQLHVRPVKMPDGVEGTAIIGAWNRVEVK